MKYVDSGNGKIPLISLLAILSISLTINLPGLAVSPMLSKLHHLFHSSELEAQLLTSLPNLVMIPVVILAGKLATPKHSTAVLMTGLIIFLVGGIGSLVSHTMGELIFFGCVVGIGCALVVPIAAGYISEWFVARPRQADLGLKSTTSNFMVIVANVFVGWIVVYNWHAAFAVYLIPVIPLALVPFMTQKYIRAHRIESQTASAASTSGSGGDKESTAYHFQGSESFRMLVALIILYVLLTYSTTSISYYAPFMMDTYGMSTTEVGIVTAAYYATVALSGAFVGRLKHFFGKSTMFICLAICAAGLLIIGLTKNFWIYTLSSLFIGFAYGIVQPIIYNKTTYIAPTQKAGMQYFGYVLSSNYLSIMMVPFVDGFFRKVFHATSPGFEFVFSGIVVVLILAWALLERKNYVFSVNPASAAPTAQMVAEADAGEDLIAKQQSMSAGIPQSGAAVGEAPDESLGQLEAASANADHAAAAAEQSAKAAELAAAKADEALAAAAAARAAEEKKKAGD